MKSAKTLYFSRQARARLCAAALMTLISLPAIGRDGLVLNDPTDDKGVEPDFAGVEHLYVVVPGPKVVSTLYRNGQQITLNTETVWRPMCGSTPGALTVQDLLAIAASHSDHVTGVDETGDGDQQDDGQQDDGGIAGGTFNIVFNLDGSVPGAAYAAFDAAEAYLETLFTDPITIIIEVGFAPMPAGVLGATGNDFIDVDWPESRESMQDDMDDNDNIQNYLPTGDKIKVRYNGNSFGVTNETRVFWTVASFKAAIGSIALVAGEMDFNSNQGWDYDPSDGLFDFSFMDVLVHEVGHILGFTSGADFRTNDMEALDIFRFQRTNGNHDYNPDTTGEFKTGSRLVDNNKPNDQHIVDVITKEYRMSDGDPYQASHFREQFDIIGLMDPAIAFGETRYPNYFSGADLRMFDAIGYDR